MIDTQSKEKQRLLDIDDFEWNDYYEAVNELMLQEKKCRQTNDTIKGAELCVQVVSISHYCLSLYRLKIWLFTFCYFLDFRSKEHSKRKIMLT